MASLAASPAEKNPSTGESPQGILKSGNDENPNDPEWITVPKDYFVKIKPIYLKMNKNIDFDTFQETLWYFFEAELSVLNMIQIVIPLCNDKAMFNKLLETERPFTYVDIINTLQNNSKNMGNALQSFLESLSGNALTNETIIKGFLDFNWSGIINPDNYDSEDIKEKIEKYLLNY